MGIFDRNKNQAAEPTDEQALARYRYMLATAPPEEIERAHEEAFAALSPEQRRQALQALAQHIPAGEIRGDDPASLARAATRAEVRQPGTIERAWGGNAGFGLGSWFMTTLAASFIGTAIAQSFFDNDQGLSGDQGAAGDSGTNDSGTDSVDGDGSDTADAGFDDGGDLGSGDLGGGDLGGGDFGGGDFGGF
jgi:hypothetical protein